MSCPWGYQLLAGACYSNCATGTTVSSIDPTLCVQVITCPVGTQADSFDNGICYKTTSTDPPCTPSQTEIEGACWNDCPAQFIEGGLSCGKRSFTRLAQAPICGGWETLQNGTCVWSSNAWIALFLLLLFIFAVIFLIVYLSRSASPTPSAASPVSSAPLILQVPYRESKLSRQNYSNILANL